MLTTLTVCQHVFKCIYNTVLFNINFEISYSYSYTYHKSIYTSYCRIKCIVQLSWLQKSCIDEWRWPGLPNCFSGYMVIEKIAHKMAFVLHKQSHSNREDQCVITSLWLVWTWRETQATCSYLQQLKTNPHDYWTTVGEICKVHQGQCIAFLNIWLYSITSSKYILYYSLKKLDVQ